ncbi:molybdopterin converting factor subunit 1 [Lysinibacillus fusiformis]|nr:molybdopterin converting factor subunit 1 [Lysinibacillus fusiformis]
MIRILLFAYLQETIGESELKVELSESTVGQVKKWMETQYPNLSLQNMMAAVNEEFATDDMMVKDGDTLAFIPPISGG